MTGFGLSGESGNSTEGTAFPAKAGIHLAGDGATGKWVPAFAGNADLLDSCFSAVGRLPAERGEGLLAREVVGCLDVAHRAGLRAHHHRMRERAGAKAPHAFQHAAVGDAGGGEHYVAMCHVEEA